MATSDSQARIRITARDDTKSAFASASQSMARLEATAATALASFAALAPAIAAAFAVKSFQGAINLLDSLNDISDATGASIEALGKLEGAARKNGASMEDVGAILVKFNAALDGAKPDSPLAQALNAIGLSAADLRKQDPADALQTVAKALSGFADDGNKARLVQELFGKSIQKAGPFLKDLAEGANLAQAGLTEQAKAAELFNKQLAALRYEGELYARSVVSQVLPALNSWLDALNKVSGFTGALQARLGIDEQGKLQSQAALLADQINRLGDSIDRMGEEQRRNPNDFLATRIEKARARMAELQKQSLATSAALKGLADQAVGANYSNEGRNFSPKRSVGDLASIGPKKTPTQDPIPQPTLDAIKALEGTDVAKIATLKDTLAALIEIRSRSGAGNIDDALLDIEDALAKLDPAAQAAIKAQEALNAALAGTPTGRIEAARKSIDELQQVLDKTADPVQAQKIKELMASLAEGIGALPEVMETTTDKLSLFAEQAARNIQDALGDTLEQAISGNFSNIGRLWEQLIFKMVAQAAAAKLNEALFGKGGFDLAGAIGEFFGFGGARAMGGPVSAGATYLVGERGPELFTPSVGGSITPNSQIAAAGNVTNINVAAGPTRSEVTAAIQLATRASEARTDAKLRRAGVA